MSRLPPRHSSATLCHEISELKKLENRRNDIKREMPRTQNSYTSRLKQSDVDDYKKRAEDVGMLIPLSFLIVSPF
jgi:hypothetical protein